MSISTFINKLILIIRVDIVVNKSHFHYPSETHNEGYCSVEGIADQ